MLVHSAQITGGSAIGERLGVGNRSLFAFCADVVQRLAALSAKHGSIVNHDGLTESSFTGGYECDSLDKAFNLVAFNAAGVNVFSWRRHMSYVNGFT